MNPIETMNLWLKNETELGCNSPNRMILATASKEAIPSSRVVAIREISEAGILFFTQRGTRKVKEMSENDQVSAVIWLPLQQRQVSIEGIVTAIKHDENLHYWKTMTHDRQLRFSAYAPTSGQVIDSPIVLETAYDELKERYQKSEVSMSEFYCGYLIRPNVINFYTLGGDSFSDVRRFVKIDGDWKSELLSP